MLRKYPSLTLADAKQMLTAAEAKAESLHIAYNIAVVDSGGHLVDSRSICPCRRAIWSKRNDI
jgi:uncharacterized protein GlcG (DUF336 family)